MTSSTDAQPQHRSEKKTVAPYHNKIQLLTLETLRLTPRIESILIRWTNCTLQSSQTILLRLICCRLAKENSDHALQTKKRLLLTYESLTKRSHGWRSVPPKEARTLGIMEFQRQVHTSLSSSKTSDCSRSCNVRFEGRSVFDGVSMLREGMLPRSPVGHAARPRGSREDWRLDEGKLKGPDPIEPPNDMKFRPDRGLDTPRNASLSGPRSSDL